MSQKIFYIFHFFIILLSVLLVALEYFSINTGILKSFTRESGFYELGSGFFLFSFGLFLLFKIKNFSPKKIKMILLFSGFIFILGALEELSWGQHLLGFESVEFAQKHNYQSEMNFHNLIPAWFFGLMVNLSFYILFVFLPIFIHLFRDKLLNTKYAKFDTYLKFFPPLELVPVFLFGFTLQKYFILDTFTDTFALIVALILLIYIVSRKKEFFFTLHISILIIITAFFMLAHEVFSYQNLQYEIREFVLIYTLIFWLYTLVISLAKRRETYE